MAARQTILHVEDDRSLQNLVRIALEQLGGYEVLTAGSGGEALALAASAPPQLALLDLNLPDMSGLATLHALRAMPGLAGVPAVRNTAAGHPDLEAELRAAGADEVLRKPFRPRLLVQAVAQVLSSRGTA
jgi:two-component system, OmpR family, response regulator